MCICTSQKFLSSKKRESFTPIFFSHFSKKNQLSFHYFNLAHAQLLATQIKGFNWANTLSAMCNCNGPIRNIFNGTHQNKQAMIHMNELWLEEGLTLHSILMMELEQFIISYCLYNVSGKTNKELWLVFCFTLNS